MLKRSFQEPRLTRDRRQILKAAALGGVAVALPPGIQAAFSVPAQGKTGTIQDVGHVVILMQENRSFDYYFGTLRGFRDPRSGSTP